MRKEDVNFIVNNIFKDTPFKVKTTNIKQRNNGFEFAITINKLNKIQLYAEESNHTFRIYDLNEKTRNHIIGEIYKHDVYLFKRGDFLPNDNFWLDMFIYSIVEK